jgi:hypothetical protein
MYSCGYDSSIVNGNWFIYCDLYLSYTFFFGWVLHYTNIVKVTWLRSSYTGGGRPHVPLHALHTETLVEPLMFCNRLAD